MTYPLACATSAWAYLSTHVQIHVYAFARAHPYAWEEDLRERKLASWLQHQLSHIVDNEDVIMSYQVSL